MGRKLIAGAAGVAVIGVAVIAAVLAFGDDGNGSSDEAIRITPPAAIRSYGVSIGTPEPIARLPGITVVGSGNVEVKADVALIRLTVGSGSRFGSDEGGIQLIDESDLDPVVQALKDAGVADDDIYVNAFGGSAFEADEGSAVIALKWPRPREVKKILSVAQAAIRRHTAFNLQGVAVTFARHDCAGPERKAMRAALANARDRALRLASLSHVKLGPLTAVSEATATNPYGALTSQRCGSEDLLSAPLLDYQTSAATADEVPVSTTIEATFAVAEP